MADSTGAETARTAVVPLRQRRRDWFFIAVFAMFATTSLLMDTVNLFGRPDPSSRWVMARYIYDNYAVGTDPMLIAVGIHFAAALLPDVSRQTLNRNWTTSRRHQVKRATRYGSADCAPSPLRSRHFIK